MLEVVPLTNENNIYSGGDEQNYLGITELVIADILGKVIFLVIILLLGYFSVKYAYDNYLKTFFERVSRIFGLVSTILEKIFGFLDSAGGEVFNAASNVTGAAGKGAGTVINTFSGLFR